MRVSANTQQFEKCTIYTNDSGMLQIPFQYFTKLHRECITAKFRLHYHIKFVQMIEKKAEANQLDEVLKLLENYRKIHDKTESTPAELQDKEWST